MKPNTLGRSAVVFDLFGTLVENFSANGQRRILAKMATVLGAPAAPFARLWAETFDDRATGRFPTIQANLSFICEALGVAASDEVIGQVAKMRNDFYGSALTPRTGAIEVLREVRTLGYRTGLISDCSLEVRSWWAATPLAPLIDASIFSCEAGVKKPNPTIYLLACERLGVLPTECLYVGDGGSNELSGARSVGMQALLLRNPHEAESIAYRSEAADWHGPAIASLREILRVLEESC